MKCPDTSVLQHFTDDPAKLGEALPEVEAHISHCQECQRNLELATRICELPNLLDVDHSSSEFDSDIEQPPDIPGYTVEHLAGRGGFGAVYRALQNSTGRPVAIKIARHFSHNQLKRNQLEANVAAQLDHPNLVRLYDYGASDSYSYYIFEWVDGNLSERLAGSLISLQQAVEWMLQLSMGVSFLHQLKIIHRDLKPSNILITSYDQVKLTDFGIVKDLSDPATTISHARAIGTPGFMAPEQVGLNGVPVGVYTDVYGLGAVLYAMLVGHAPFVGGDSRSVMSQVVEQQPYAPSKVRHDLPRDLEVICLKCLEKDHHDRYASVAELSQDLQRYASGEPIQARPISRTARLCRACKRQPIVAALSVAISVLAILAVSLPVMLSRREQAQQAELMTQSFCKLVVSASPDKLATLYEHVGDYSPISIRRNIETLSVDPQLSAAGRIRLLCLLPETECLQFSPDQLASAMEQLSASEVVTLVKRLEKCAIVSSPNTIQQLKSRLQTGRPDAANLPIISLLAEVDPDWSEWHSQADFVLKSLAFCPIQDALSWARLLAPIDVHLFAAANSPSITNEMQDVAQPSPVSDLPSSEHLTSDSVLAAAWHWAQRDQTRIVALIKSMPVSKLAVVKSLDGVQRSAVLPHLRRDLTALRAKLFDWQVISSSQELNDSVSQAGGQLSARGGFVTTMLQSNAGRLVEGLNRDGMRLTSIQPYEKDGLDFFAATFERVVRTSDQKSDPDRSFCEISWSVELSEVANEVAQHAERGLHVEAFWAIPELPIHRVAILWRDDALPDSRFIWDPEDVDAFAKTLDLTDSSQLETELLKQTIVLDSSQSVYWRLGLLKQRPISTRDERTRRFVRLVDRSIGFHPETTPSRWVEHMSAGPSYLSIAAELPMHSKQSQMLLESGYQPLAICMEPNSAQVLSQWCLKHSSQHDEMCQELVSLSLAAWLLGDQDPVFDTIVFSRDPSLRTQVVETLGNIDQTATNFEKATERQLTVSQLHGLLLALGNWNANRLMLHKKELLPWLMAMWDHNDSGIHFTADHILRRMAIPEYKPIVRTDLVHSHGLAQCVNGRRWYYGPYGLPFAIVGPRELEMLGCDERIPWIPTIDRRMGTLSRTIAVCAIETPDWLMQRHLQETKAEASFPQNTVRDGPAAGYKLHPMLNFCNWLSQKDGISTPTIFIPPTPTKEEAQRDPNSLLSAKCFLEADGYRLPTNLEWEMFARAGTWTSNHLGDRFDFLSNYGWSSANCESHPRPVALLKPNPLGLFDVLGNVYEHALGGDGATGFSDHPESYEGKSFDPRSIVNIRGGSFLSSRIYCSSGSSHHVSIKSGDVNAGFRIVRTLPNH